MRICSCNCWDDSCPHCAAPESPNRRCAGKALSDKCLADLADFKIDRSKNINKDVPLGKFIKPVALSEPAILHSTAAPCLVAEMLPSNAASARLLPTTATMHHLDCDVFARARTYQ